MRRIECWSTAKSSPFHLLPSPPIPPPSLAHRPPNICSHRAFLFALFLLSVLLPFFFFRSLRTCYPQTLFGRPLLRLASGAITSLQDRLFVPRATEWLAVARVLPGKIREASPVASG